MIVPKSADGDVLSEAALSVSKVLFSLPLEVKLQCQNMSDRPYESGWRATENGSEFWHLSSEEAEKNFPSSCSISPSPIVRLMKEAARCVVPRLIQALCAEHGVDAHQLQLALGDRATRARLIRYGADSNVRFEPHLDSGLITIFAAQSVRSLAYWVDEGWCQEIPENCWLVGCGRTLSDHSGIPALKHKVLEGDSARLACALFFHDEIGRLNEPQRKSVEP
jgi:isopenicillin N synthase-like dioxygenase